MTNKKPNNSEKVKPMFIPLKRKYFEAFKRGKKNYELRPYGKRWNEKVCYKGREVVLSLGYGKQSRLSGKIIKFEKSITASELPSWKEIYGDDPQEVAVIFIKLNEVKK